MLANPDLIRGIANCTNCRLAKDRGIGLSVPAEPGKLYQLGGLAIFLEAPGADEEKHWDTLESGEEYGRPLNGRSGILMDTLLSRAGTSRADVLVLNRIRCRPPRNQINDYPDAVSQCDPWVVKELNEYAPSVVLLSGNTALRSVFGATASITSVRGSCRATSDSFAYGKRVFIPTFHPAYAARNGGENSEIGRLIVSDIKLALDVLSG